MPVDCQLPAFTMLSNINKNIIKHFTPVIFSMKINTEIWASEQYVVYIIINVITKIFCC